MNLVLSISSSSGTWGAWLSLPGQHISHRWEGASHDPFTAETRTRRQSSSRDQVSASLGKDYRDTGKTDVTATAYPSLSGHRFQLLATLESSLLPHTFPSRPIALSGQIVVYITAR